MVVSLRGKRASIPQEKCRGDWLVLWEMQLGCGRGTEMFGLGSEARHCETKEKKNLKNKEASSIL